MIDQNDLEYYITLLRDKKPFSFTRWGDGEWLCTYGASGNNCDGHEYFSDMSDSLRKVFDQPDRYFLATWPLQEEPMMFNLPGELRQFIASRRWADARIWEEAAMAGKLGSLVNQLEDMNFIIVSEPSKRELDINYTDFIDIPSKNCFLDKERIKQEMRKMCEKYDMPVFGLSASMASNVIVDELFEELGKKCWMIDFGSIWEPFLKNPVHSRSYHSKYKSTSIKEQIHE